ncbi:hypothetical protein [Nocardioides lianchengensis]|nr:hypothetical protein [Nocardioides lianchengensis]NYG12480.1 hypothetical protein [Nocardioides lianchengensis]
MTVVWPYRLSIGAVLDPETTEDLGQIISTLRANVIANAAYTEHWLSGKCRVRVVATGAAGVDLPPVEGVASWVLMEAQLQCGRRPRPRP